MVGLQELPVAINVVFKRLAEIELAMSFSDNNYNPVVDMSFEINHRICCLCVVLSLYNIITPHR